MAQSPVLSEETYFKEYDPQVTRRLFGYTTPYRRQLLLALLMMFIGSAAAVAGPYFVKVALDSGMQAGSLPALRQAVLLYAAAAATQWAATYLRVNIMARAAQSIIYDLRARLFEHLQLLSLSFYSRFSVGRVITRVMNDVGVLREFLTWTVLAVARDLFTLAGILIAMLAMDLRLSLITFTVLPVMLAITIVLRRKARQNYRLVRVAISWVNSVLAENINAVRVVQAFSRQETNYAFYRDEVNRNNLNANVRAAQVAAAFPAAIDLLGAIATSLVVWLGGAAVLGAQSGAITPGVLVAFVLYIGRFFDPIRDLSRRYDTFQSTMAGGERIFALMDTPVEVQDAADAIELPSMRGEVRLENVSFHYSDDPTPVLQGVNLHVHPGESIALVGKTGAGKTTLVKLLSRFHDPTTGRVCVDGHDLRQVTQHSLRSQMGIVLQDPFLFSGTIAENMRFSCPEASDSEMEAAAQAVGLADFISQLPQGYDTPVEEGGVLLSVGQRQLLSFARALLADPRILILDEATSSVDTQTEMAIQKALACLMQTRTSFVIAHRLSTVVNADRIVVIEDGQIVEHGSHRQLLEKGGVYYRLYLSGFED
jgi:ATP-binding cassette subfamily B multidrug efflux pump